MRYSFWYVMTTTMVVVGVDFVGMMMTMAVRRHCQYQLTHYNNSRRRDDEANDGGGQCKQQWHLCDFVTFSLYYWHFLDFCGSMMRTMIVVVVGVVVM